jgi:signal recognition particle receptor subunit beta
LTENVNKILLLGKDEKNSNLLSSLFKDKDIDVFVVKNIPDAINLLSSSELNLILIDFQVIVDAERKILIKLFKDAQTTKFVIFDVPVDAGRRLAFYGLGAYRILDVNYNVEDVYYFSQNLLADGKPVLEEKESHFSGRIQDFGLHSLINNFGKEKRSGVLRLQTPVSSGKIYFNYGHIYHASAGYLKDDDAVYYMLTWNKGRFSMSNLSPRRVNNRVKLSNVGLLLQGEYIREKFLSLVKELGGLSKEMCVINKGDLILEEKDQEFKNFLEKITDFRQVFDIIENSPYQMIDTLKHLVSLKKSGNLKTRESGEVLEGLYLDELQESSGLTERLLSIKEINELRENLRATELNSGKLLVLGSSTCGKTDFIRQLNQGSTSSVRSDQELDFTVIELADDFSLQVFGITIEERLSQIIEKISENLVGYIFLIDAGNEDELEYTNYVINNLISTHNVPWTIAVTNMKKRAKKIPQKIKTKIHVGKGRTFLICDVKNKEHVRKVVMSITASD